MKLRTYWRRYVIGALALVVALAVGGPWVYANLVAGSEPAPLSVGTGQSAPTGELTGTWTVATGSQAGYRVAEVLGGQDVQAVGRTDDVTGTAALDGTAVTAARVEVQVATIASDQSRRDGRFAGDIMDTAQYPTATFTLTDAVDLGTAFGSGQASTVDATGQLTLHGVTRTVTFPVTAVRDGATITVSGAIPVTFADYGIETPTIADFVTVEPTGQVEFLLTLSAT